MRNPKATDHSKVTEKEIQWSPVSDDRGSTGAGIHGDVHELPYKAKQDVAHGSKSRDTKGTSLWRTKDLELPLVQRVTSTLAGSELGSATTPPAKSWRTAFIRLGPLAGISGMFMALVGIVASLGILAGSDGVPVASWTVPPSTYLAICTALANVSMRYAAIHGVVIAWWVRASKGATLAKLHHDWRAGTTLGGQ